MLAGAKHNRYSEVGKKERKKERKGDFFSESRLCWKTLALHSLPQRWTGATVKKHERRSSVFIYLFLSLWSSYFAVQDASKRIPNSLFNVSQASRLDSEASVHGLFWRGSSKQLLCCDTDARFGPISAPAEITRLCQRRIPEAPLARRLSVTTDFKLAHRNRKSRTTFPPGSFCGSSVAACEIGITNSF